MKNKTTLKEARGKTFTDFVSSGWGQTVLIFGDEYVCLGVKSGCQTIEDEIEECDLHMSDFSMETLIEKVLLSKEKMESMRENDSQPAQ